MASVTPVTVVVTRPLGQSAGLLALLAAAGFEPLEFPLIDIDPVADDFREVKGCRLPWRYCVSTVHRSRFRRRRGEA